MATVFAWNSAATWLVNKVKRRSGQRILCRLRWIVVFNRFNVGRFVTLDGGILRVLVVVVHLVLGGSFLAELERGSWLAAISRLWLPLLLGGQDTSYISFFAENTISWYVTIHWFEFKASLWANAFLTVDWMSHLWLRFTLMSNACLLFIGKLSLHEV